MTDLTLEERVTRLERLMGVEQPPVPYLPIPVVSPAYCSRCGLKLEGAMGYVCGDRGCPIGLSGAWS